MDKVKFSLHSLKRARQRRLWRYVNKKLFYFDAQYLDGTRVLLKDCVYAFRKIGDQTVITTMYPLSFLEQRKNTS